MDTELIQALLVPVIGYLLVELRRFLTTKLTPERLQAVSQLARVAVEASEELGRAADGDFGPGEKYEYAERVLKQSARRVGVKLTNDEAAAFIHSVLTGKRDEVERVVDDVLAEIFGAAGFPSEEEGDEEAA